MTSEEAREALSVLKIYDAQWLREAVDMAIEALQEVQKHEETFEWCTECKEYDKDNHCCHRWSKTIRNTVEELKTDRPHGEWIVCDYDLKLKCSICGETFNFDDVDELLDYKEYAKYCLVCGADMKGGAE